MRSIHSLMKAAGGNFARTNKFRLRFSVPFLRGIGADTIDALANSVRYPGFSHETVTLNIKGHPVELPARTRNNNEFSVTFYLDENYNIYETFKYWIANIDDYGVDPSGNLYDHANIPYGSCVIDVFDYSMTSTRKWLSIEMVYPTSISDIDYNTQGQNEIATFTVIFKYIIKGN